VSLALRPLNGRNVHEGPQVSDSFEDRGGGRRAHDSESYTGAFRYPVQKEMRATEAVSSEEL
jgi:hypothetical protein